MMEKEKRGGAERERGEDTPLSATACTAANVHRKQARQARSAASARAKKERQGAKLPVQKCRQVEGKRAAAAQPERSIEKHPRKNHGMNGSARNSVCYARKGKARMCENKI